MEKSEFRAVIKHLHLKSLILKESKAKNSFVLNFRTEFALHNRSATILADMRTLLPTDYGRRIQYCNWLQKNSFLRT